MSLAQRQNLTDAGQVLVTGKVFDFCSRRRHSLASENRERLTITRERLKKETAIAPLLVGPL
jgi:hypothetical protein